MEYSKIREMLKGLINENSNDKDVETISQIVDELNTVEKENQELAEKHEALREKYINAVRNSAFNDNIEKTENDTPKTLEECIQAEIDKRK